MTARRMKPLSTPAKAAASALLVLLAAFALTLITVPGANGAFLAKITNDNDTAATDPYFTCANAAAKDYSGLSPYLVYPLSTPVAGGSAADVSGNSRTGTYSATGIASASDGTVCPRDTQTSLTKFSGTSTGLVPGGGYVVATPTATAVAGPNTFSVAAWFQTSTAGGMIVGFGDSKTAAASGSYDRHLYIGADGLLYFGVYNATTFTTNSTAKVNDGAWHFAVGTFSPGSLNLYVDGQHVGTTNTGTTTAQSFSGYWRVGYDNLNGWPDVPTNFYFNGNMAWAGVYSAALTPTQVTQLYTAGR